MDITSGAVSPRVNRGEPQSEQKLRVASLPLPARTEYVFGLQAPAGKWSSRVAISSCRLNVRLR